MSPPEKPDRKGDKPFWINGLPKQIRSKIRVQKRSGCWLWQGTIRPARERRRLPRYASRVHDVFGDPFGLEREAALPEVWDGRTGKKVAAHRFVRSVLTCVPIEAVPRLSRCHDPRCVSPWHNLEIGSPPSLPKAFKAVGPAPSTASETVAGAGVDVLAALKEHRPLTELGEADFPLIEEECGLPAGSVTTPAWAEYVAWDEENPEP